MSTETMHFQEREKKQKIATHTQILLTKINPTANLIIFKNKSFTEFQKQQKEN
jgi:hypothetical protein